MGVDRRDPEPDGSERDLLIQYLAFQRQTVLAKTDGLDDEQLARTHPPSTLRLGGLLFHLALVEETWAEVRFAGLPDREPWAGVDWEADPDWELRTVGGLGADELRDRYRLACWRTDEVVASSADLGALSAVPRKDGRPFSLRWMLLHLIEETARHAGHADLLREAVDGQVGE